MAELLAAWFLSLKFYSVCAKRYKAPGGEVDLIARQGPWLVFVEVKWRSDLDAGLEAVTLSAQARITHAAAHYISRHAHLAHSPVRFDVIALAPWRWPVHLKGAFEAHI